MYVVEALKATSWETFVHHSNLCTKIIPNMAQRFRHHPLLWKHFILLMHWKWT